MQHIQTLEARRHFAVSVGFLAPNIAFVNGDAPLPDGTPQPNSADTITVSSVPTPTKLYDYDFTANGTTINADTVHVYAHGGNDTVTLTNVFMGEVAGGPGDDTVTLIDSSRVRVGPLSPGDPAGPDGVDTLELQGSIRCSLDGGTGDDVFRTSGDSGESALTGGDGNDDFAVGGVFVNSTLTGGNHNDIITGSGNWDRAQVFGDDGNDAVDLRAVTGNILVLDGGWGNDRLFGGSGKDSISGGPGDDWMEGGAGDDYFNAVDGVPFNDTIIGGGHVLGDRADIDAPGERRVARVEFINPV